MICFSIKTSHTKAPSMQKKERRASLAGFEPATHCLEGSCSIQLSYRDTLVPYCTDGISGRSSASHPDQGAGHAVAWSPHLTTPIGLLTEFDDTKRREPQTLNCQHSKGPGWNKIHQSPELAEPDRQPSASVSLDLDTRCLAFIF